MRPWVSTFLEVLGLTYHISITVLETGGRKCMILKTERCWSGRSGTLGNRFRLRVLTHTDTHQRTPHQRLSRNTDVYRSVPVSHGV